MLVLPASLPPSQVPYNDDEAERAASILPHQCRKLQQWISAEETVGVCSLPPPSLLSHECLLPWLQVPGSLATMLRAWQQLLRERPKLTHSALTELEQLGQSIALAVTTARTDYN